MENTKKIILTTEDADRLENMILYYDYHTVKGMQQQRPGFVTDDFETVLKILAKVFEIDL